MDLYRLSGLEEAEESGLMEYFAENAVAAVEWPDPIEEVIRSEASLPRGAGRKTVTVAIIQGAGEDTRTIEIEVPDGSGIMAEER
jgi:tRNA A37 threonylcarbamoyladenosine biosynthesis protein TsaE